MRCLRKLLILASFHASALGAPLEDRYEEKDLATFVTRPDIRPPTFDLTVHDKNAITPGYWFVSPYVDLKTRVPTSAFSPGQIGPHIYDNDGNLVYSGAHLVGDRTSFDFKAVSLNGTQHFSLLLDHDDTKTKFTAGAGVLLNSHFEVVSTVQNTRGNRLMNMHEFNVVDAGKSALTITYEPQLIDYSNGKGEGPYGWIGNNGFQEVNLLTNEVTFEWWALDHIDPDESTMGEPGKVSGTWDWFHMNSVDKNSEGDYLISARYTNAIYKISGQDGSVIWRLGGKKSSFKQKDFHFSSQHDARFRHTSENASIISFLNNAANGHTKTANKSSVIVAALDTETMSASLVQEFQRPDGGLTKLRGNAQELENGNYFICWSENGHVSEHKSNGELAMEAQFSSKRFVTYRAAKFNFTGRPDWKPAVKGFAYGLSPETSTTAVYVSWNGATDVATWRFWGSLEEFPFENYDRLGEIDKSGFESMFMMDGYVQHVFVEAISADGGTLGVSTVNTVTVPDTWTSEKISEYDRKTGDHSTLQLDAEHEAERVPDENDIRWPNSAQIFSRLDAKLIKDKRTATVAVYLWVATITFFVLHVCINRYKNRRQSWMKSEKYCNLE